MYRINVGIHLKPPHKTLSAKKRCQMLYVIQECYDNKKHRMKQLRFHEKERITDDNSSWNGNEKDKGKWK